jgi:hypothetical protein
MRIQSAFHVWLFSVISSVSSFAQSGYEPGYFIDNSSKRVECTIYNQDWLRSPETFRYKLPGSDNQQEGSIGNVSEFGVGSVRFVRYTGQIDTTSQNVKALAMSPNPQWYETTVFLKVVTGGKGKVYRFRNPKLELFFFSVDNSPIEPLVYRRVSTQAIKQMAGAMASPGYVEDFTFRRQLLAKVKCGSSSTQVKTLRYQESSLRSYFESYNRCNGEKVQPTKSSNGFVTASAGFDAGELHVYQAPATINESDPGYRLGVSGELFLPFNNRKWTVMGELAYQASSSSTGNRSHRSLEIPIGVRHYFYLPKSFSLFLNAFAVMDLASQYRADNAFAAQGFTGCGAFGAGLQFKKLIFETRYYSPRNFDLQYYQYKKLSFTVGLRILN